MSWNKTHSKSLEEKVQRIKQANSKLRDELKAKDKEIKKLKAECEYDQQNAAMSKKESIKYLNKIAELEKAMKPKTCEWRQCTSEYDTSWEGTCGIKWILIDGTPTENYMQFCPKCGGKLVEFEPKDKQ